MRALSDGTAFLDVRDAAKLDWFMQPSINAVRADLASFYVMIKFVIARASSSEGPSEERLVNVLLAMVKQAISAMKHFDSLLRYAQNIRKRGLARNIRL